MMRDNRLHLYYKDPKVKFELKKRAINAKLSLSQYLLITSSIYENLQQRGLLK